MDPLTDCLLPTADAFKYPSPIAIMHPSTLGAYFHVPFCASTCDFCAFYQESPHREQLELYLSGMEREWGSLAIENRVIDTAFWGGGTPGLLSTKDLDRLGQIFLNGLSQPPLEWTVEMAPSTVKKEKVAVLQNLGVNRISVGAQSFQPHLLATLGRRQTPKQLFKAVECLREGGVHNLNLDLIIAIPGQTLRDLEADLEAALSQEPEHISTYMLTFEEDTALYSRWLRGGLQPKSAEQEANDYSFVQQYLRAAGFEQYEVSNYARPGFACQHNVNTWLMGDWLGIGPSAASQYRGKRWNNTPHLERWLKGIELNQWAREAEMILSEESLVLDCMIFGLRTRAGIDLSLLQKRFPSFDSQQYQPLWTSFIEEGLLQKTKDERLSPTDAGLLLADAIALEIMQWSESHAHKG